MNGAVFSPSALGEATNSPVKMQKMLAGLVAKSTRFYIDTEGAVLSEYAGKAKTCDKARTLLKFALLSDPKTFVKYSIPRGSCSFEEFEISLAACSATDRNIITDSSLRYAQFAKKMASKDVSIYDVDRFDFIFGVNSGLTYAFLSKLLMGCLQTMIMHKSGKKIEDLHNDILTALLRQYGGSYDFQVSDQSRAGGTANGNIGELDLYVLKGVGTPFSVIECLRSSSFGAENSVVPEHLDKLLHQYDKLGFSKNFLVTYCEASNFGKAFDGYVDILKNINNNPKFKGKYKSCAIHEGTVMPNFRQLVTTHLREGVEVEVIHYFCDFS